MSYDSFKQKVSALSARTGVPCRFFNDAEKGRYSAIFADGTRITGNSSNLKITARFGDGHQAMAVI